MSFLKTFYNSIIADQLQNLKSNPKPSFTSQIVISCKLDIRLVASTD